MDVYARMKDLGITLPEPPAKAGLYAQAKEFGPNLVYISGCGPAVEGQTPLGKLGVDLTLEQGYNCARNAMLNVLAVLEKHIGDLNRVKNVAKILVFVASADDFYQQPQVANGASQVLIDVFGEEVGIPSRSAVGTNALPGNIPVEVEALFELK